MSVFFNVFEYQNQDPKFLLFSSARSKIDFLIEPSSSRQQFRYESIYLVLKQKQQHMAQSVLIRGKRSSAMIDAQSLKLLKRIQ